MSKKCGNCKYIVFDDVTAGQESYLCCAPVPQCVEDIGNNEVEEEDSAKDCKAYKRFKFKETK